MHNIDHHVVLGRSRGRSGTCRDLARMPRSEQATVKAMCHPCNESRPMNFSIPSETQPQVRLQQEHLLDETLAQCCVLVSYVSVLESQANILVVSGEAPQDPVVSTKSGKSNDGNVLEDFSDSKQAMSMTDG